MQNKTQDMVYACAAYHKAIGDLAAKVSIRSFMTQGSPDSQTRCKRLSGTLQAMGYNDTTMYRQ